jgi:lysozyme
LGLDLSHNNAAVPLSANLMNDHWIQKYSIKFVIHKATQGMAFTDDTWERRAEQCRDLGLLFGLYHFGTAGAGAEQAKRFLDVAASKNVKLLALDFESAKPGETMSPQHCVDFVRQIFRETNKWPVIYGGALLRLSMTLPICRGLALCPLWISHYSGWGNPTGLSEPRLPSFFPDWQFWQYTDGAARPKLSGAYSAAPASIPGFGDLDLFNGTPDELQAVFSGTE